MGLELEGMRKEEIARGNEARVILEAPLYVEAVETLRDRINTEWQNSPVRETEAREKLWMMLKCLNGVDGHLRVIMETGKLASLELEQKRTMSQKARDIWDGMNW